MLSVSYMIEPVAMGDIIATDDDRTLLGLKQAARVLEAAPQGRRALADGGDADLRGRASFL